VSTAAIAAPAEEHPSWQEVVLSFAPPDQRRGTRLVEWVDRAPFVLILLVQAVLSWRLSNITSDDEGLYIDTGHDMLTLLLHHGRGLTGTAYGTYLSGAPAVYPVLAGTLDSFGGLRLVRFASLVFMLITTVCVRSITAKLFDRRTALLAAFACALSGSVLYVGKYATYDAMSVMLIVVAVYLALVRRSVLSALTTGLLLALAAATKYSAIAEAPFVIVVLALRPNLGAARNAVRTVSAALTAVGALAGSLYEWGAPIRAGIAFTTTSRLIESYHTRWFLIRDLGRDLGIVAVLATLGLVVLARGREWQRFLVVGTLAAAGLALPIDQIRIHEFVSFDKQTDFAGAFLAIPAAVGANWALSRRALIKMSIFLLGWLVLLSGLSESFQNYQWPASISAPLAKIRADPIPGNYMTFDQGTVVYYTRGVPQVHWLGGFVLFGDINATAPAVTKAANERIVAAEGSHTYAGFLYTRGENGKPFDNHLNVLQAALAADPYYHLVGTWRLTPYQKYRWYLWQRTTTPLHFTAVPTATREPSPAPSPVPGAAVARPSPGTSSTGAPLTPAIPAGLGVAH
jgi:hypothetical protein